MSDNSPAAAAAAIVRKSRSNLAFALASLPEERREDMYAFYAFCRIVDDIADTAGTLCKAADLLMKSGAKEVHSYITHGVLSKGAVARVAGSAMKSLVITDSIEASEEVLNSPNIRIVPTAPIFAQAILNIWSGTSVSSLFETETLVPIYEGMYQRS